MPRRPDITLVFMDLPSDSIASQSGENRHDEVLPGKRVIHIDADTLVPKNLMKYRYRRSPHRCHNPFVQPYLAKL